MSINEIFMILGAVIIFGTLIVMVFSAFRYSKQDTKDQLVKSRQETEVSIFYLLILIGFICFVWFGAHWVAEAKPPYQPSTQQSSNKSCMIIDGSEYCKTK